jgi:hypothetical protein
MKRIVPRWESVQYDGTNGDFICGEFLTPPATKISEDGGVLVYEVQGYQRTVNLNDHVLREGSLDPWGSAMSPTEYAQRYYELPE